MKVYEDDLQQAFFTNGERLFSKGKGRNELCYGRPSKRWDKLLAVTPSFPQGKRLFLRKKKGKTHCNMWVKCCIINLSKEVMINVYFPECISLICWGDIK